MTRELVCVVADKNIEAGISGLIGMRKKALKLGDFEYNIHVHARRDPGCYYEGPDMLRGLLGGNQARGLLIFDYAWSGNPHSTSRETENHVRSRLTNLDIGDRTDTVVIDPEIEAWVWSTSPLVPQFLGWEERELRPWLESNDLWNPNCSKPTDPKLALESALYQKRIPRSSSIYRSLAERVSTRRCNDASFNRLCGILQRWFPDE